MDNLDIARELDTLADLLEIQGANPFRIRAYRNAVNTVRSSSRAFADMVEAGEDLTLLPDIGEKVADHITELLQHGTIGRMEEVTRAFPRSLAELVRLEGLGPKKVRKLFDELGVRTVEELADALDEGAVETLEGFGKKSAEKLRAAIEDHRKHTGRFQIHEVEQLVAGVLEHMADAPGVGRFEVAGSLRRRKETIGDVDLLAEHDGDGTPVVEHFVSYGGARRVLGSGSTKGSIVLHSGLQVDLRVIPAASFGAALLYFTGSKEHNVALRTRAVRDGLRVNEWGVYRVNASEQDGSGDGDRGGDRDFGVRVAGDTEEEVYEALGPPVDRARAPGESGRDRRSSRGPATVSRDARGHQGRPPDALDVERRSCVLGRDGPRLREAWVSLYGGHRPQPGHGHGGWPDPGACQGPVGGGGGGA